MTAKTKAKLSNSIRYVVLIAVGIILIYPLVWMIGATFKTNNEIFSSIGIIPKAPTLDGYRSAMRSYGGNISLFKSMGNTYFIVIPKVVFTLLSTVLVAYGFARFKFYGHKIFFPIMISTLFLPQVVLNVPQFMMYNSLGWIDSRLYLPLVVPALFATDTYFVFMLVQFLRNIPREMEEAAEIDGCGTFKTLTAIIVPVLKPAIISCGLFQFMWSSNDFMGPLLYVNSPSYYPVSLFVKMSMDADTGFEWNRVLAMSLIAIVPSLIVFFIAQNQFVDGIAAGSVKG